jgi:YHS domain-containing protein
MAIDSEQAAAREFWNGQTFYFCSKSCHEKFRATPDRYPKADQAAMRGSQGY